MSGELFVEEGIVGLDQFQNAAVVAHDVAERPSVSLPHGSAQFAVQFNLGPVAKSFPALFEHLLKLCFLFLGPLPSGMALSSRTGAAAFEIALLTAVASQHYAPR